MTAEDTTVSSADFRAHFPICATKAHLASCSLGAQSDRVIDAIARFMASWCEDGAPWREWMGLIEDARAGFARLINALPEEIAVLPNASEGAFQVASGLDYSTRRQIVSCDMEFPSIAHVWLAQRPRGAQVVYAPETDGVVHVESYTDLISEDSALVSIPLVSYKNGCRLPVADVTAAAHRHGARVFVDAYQIAGILPVDVRALNCDYLVAGMLKYLLGMPGMAFLYVRGGLKHEHDPQLTGWFGRENPYALHQLRELDFPEQARRFETGTPSIPAAYAAVAGLSLVAQLDNRCVQEHVAELTAQLTDDLTCDGEALYSPADPLLRGPQLAVVTKDPEDLAAFLAAHGVVVSPRGHVVRLAVHYYTDAGDLARAQDGIRAYRATDNHHRS